MDASSVDRQNYWKNRTPGLPSQTTSPKNEIGMPSSKAQDWLDDVAKKMAMEDHGQNILDHMAYHNISPQKEAETFWSDTYFKLPPEVQLRFRKMLNSHTGKSLTRLGGDVSEAAKELDLGNAADGLGGTDRGFAVLMYEANRRFLRGGDDSIVPENGRLK
jgi:hypothetical protein